MASFKLCRQAPKPQQDQANSPRNRQLAGFQQSQLRKRALPLVRSLARVRTLSRVGALSRARAPSRKRALALLLPLALLASACAENEDLNRIAAEIRSSTTLELNDGNQGNSSQENGGDSSGGGGDSGESEDSGAETSDEDEFDPSIIPPEADQTPLPIDPDYRIGTLANGLTYLLRSNDSPGGNVDVRLLVNAGSAQQEDGSDGSAHFLEHMLFNGTEKYPKNELTAQLQRLGIAFGPDVNAFTSFDETVYLLSAFSHDDPSQGVSSLETAFDVLSQWASAATLDPEEVEAEKGVVRDEMRQRVETVQGIIGNEFTKIYIANTPYEGHLILGDANKIENTTPSSLRQFYDTWYRPDNMAVVAVGDLPLDELESLVVEHFDGLRSRSNSPPERTEFSIGIGPEPQVHIVTHPDNAVDNLSLDFPIHARDTGTTGGFRINLMEDAIEVMISNRLSDAYLSGDLVLREPPFFFEFFLNRELRYFGTNLKADDLNVGLADYLSYLEPSEDNGFTEEEIERMLDMTNAAFDQELSGVNTIGDSHYADLLTEYWLKGADIDETRARIARSRSTLESFTAEELDNHWRWLRGVGGPIVVAVGADSSTLPTEEELLETLNNARAAQPVLLDESLIEAGELMEAPTAVLPTSVDEHDDGTSLVTTWTFPNGIKVSHRQIPIEDNNFSIQTASSGGWSALARGSPGASNAMAEIAVNAVFGSGVGPHDALALQRLLSTRDTHLSANIGQSEEGFSGQSATRDAETLFQLLYLYITAARVDEVGLRTALNQAQRSLAITETHVDHRARTVLNDLIYAGDPAQHLAATQEQIDSLNAQDALDIYNSRLGKVDDLAIAVVGDISSDKVRDFASRYLGSIPQGLADTWVDLGYEIPTGTQMESVELSEGTTDGGIFVYQAAPIELTAKNRATARLLQGIINNQIIERIREELGASYGGFTTITFEREPEPSIKSLATVGGDPNRLNEIRNTLMGVFRDLVTFGPTSDQFEQAHNVIQNDWHFVNSGLLMNQYLEAIRFPDEDRLTTLNRDEILSEVTPDDVRQLAELLYGGGNWLEVAKVLPR